MEKVKTSPNQLPLFDGIFLPRKKRSRRAGKPKPPKSEKYQATRKRCRQIFESLGDDDLRLTLASELTLDQIRGMIDRFPAEYQQQMVALLTNGYLEKWRKDGV